MSWWQRFFSSRRLFLASTPAAAERVAPALLRAEPDSGPLYRKQAEPWLIEWMAGIPDPDVVLLRTGKTRADLRDLLRDSEVSQALDTRREAVLATPWRLEGGGSRASKFIVDELAPHVQHIVATAWDAVQFGYSVLWVDFVRRGGRVTINTVEAPPFEWFKPLPDRSLRYFPQDGSNSAHGLECDPRYYFLTARNATSRNPYGEALLSVLYWPVTWRLQGWQLWLNFLDTYGSPIMVGKVTNYNKFVEAMTAQGVTRSIGWQGGENESVEAITASAAGEFERLEDALDRCIQRVVLGQTLTSDVGSSGSFAAAKIHNEVRDDKRRADLRLVVDTAQRVVTALWSLNGFTGQAPLFLMQDNVGLELERAERDDVLTGMGVRLTESYFRERYDLEAEDFTLTDPNPPPRIQQQALPPGKKLPKAQLAALLAANRFTPSQQVIERGIDEVLGNLGDVIASAEIKAAIRAASSPEDLIDRLAALVEDADAPLFQQTVERALFAADILGYAHASPTQQ